MDEGTTGILLIGLATVFIIAAVLLWNTLFKLRGKRRQQAAHEGLNAALAKARQNIPTPEQVTPHPNSPVKWDHPANRGVLNVLAAHSAVQGLYDAPPGDSGEVPLNHPDIVDHVYRGLNGKLPEDCRWIAYSRPILVHPRTGVVFAFGMGSACVAVRLPEAARTTGRWLPRWGFGSGSDSIEQADLGADWVFEGGGADSAASGLAAYEHAGQS